MALNVVCVCLGSLVTCSCSVLASFLSLEVRTQNGGENPPVRGHQVLAPGSPAPTRRERFSISVFFCVFVFCFFGRTELERLESDGARVRQTKRR